MQCTLYISKITNTHIHTLFFFPGEPVVKPLPAHHWRYLWERPSSPSSSPLTLALGLVWCHQPLTAAPDVGKELELGCLILLYSPLQRRWIPSCAPGEKSSLGHIPGQRAEGPKTLELACSAFRGVSTCWLTPSRIRPLTLPWEVPPSSLSGFWQEPPNWSSHFYPCPLYSLSSTASQRDLVKKQNQIMSSSTRSPAVASLQISTAALRDPASCYLIPVSCCSTLLYSLSEAAELASLWFLVLTSTSPLRDFALAVSCLECSSFKHLLGSLLHLLQIHSNLTSPSRPSLIQHSRSHSNAPDPPTLINF